MPLHRPLMLNVAVVEVASNTGEMKFYELGYDDKNIYKLTVLSSKEISELMDNLKTEAHQSLSGEKKKAVDQYVAKQMKIYLKRESNAGSALLQVFSSATLTGKTFEENSSKEADQDIRGSTQSKEDLRGSTQSKEDLRGSMQSNS